jgi:hypothetical protein
MTGRYIMIGLLVAVMLAATGCRFRDRGGGHHGGGHHVHPTPTPSPTPWSWKQHYSRPEWHWD